MLLMLQNNPFSPQQNKKKGNTFMYIYIGNAKTDMRHNLCFARKKSYICIVNWSVGDSKVKRHLPVDLSCTPTTVNSMGIFIQDERTNKRMEASRRI